MSLIAVGILLVLAFVGVVSVWDCQNHAKGRETLPFSRTPRHRCTLGCGRFQKEAA